MALTIGMRTIWVVIRGKNYASQALRQTGKDVDELIKKQQRLAQQAQQLMFAGVMYSIFGAMVAMTMMKFIEMTSLGALYAEDFRRVLERVGIALGEAVIDNFGWAIEAFIGFLDALSQNAPIINFIAIALVMGGSLLILLGFLKIVTGAVITLLGWLGVAPTTIGAVTAALGTLWGILFMVIAGFMAGYAIGQLLADTIGGPLTTAIGLLIAILVPLVVLIWSLATGVSISTAGIAAIAGIAAMGAGIALAGVMASSAQEQALIGQSISQSVLPSAFVQRPTLGTGTGAGTTYVAPVGGEGIEGGNTFDIDIGIDIGEINTEADIDEMAEKVAVKLAEKIDEQIG